MPQQVRGNEPLDRYVVNVDEIEERTGFNFFPKIENKLQEKLESSIDPKPWDLNTVSRLPARY